MIGLRIKLECPSCGAVLKSDIPADTAKMVRAVITDAANPRCSCGRQCGFKILGYEEIEYELVKGEK